MELEAIGIILVIGGVAGWLAGALLKGGGMGLVGNIIVGIIGSVLGGVIFQAAGISLGGGLIGAIISATVGAVILLLVLGAIKK
ncbi:GlsB/YeaQ/YmgE family stress response membrane protein [Umboniibacter marinipuniceus]|uniref:Transglycosylase associated protein n=1 Tax=Umboniibacter marinipuniceus TaxID=569599 RepID=A0A3M0A265_9GAMM|nr:GlsB/YeaQ/YmgE family stress response membrane protein [Umboniibacter marinipuniceus]RMA78737.1 transglycosylase associated protein [Umboniibacter marinipuniceus]